MRIVLAPDSFKESLSAAEICRAMAAGIQRVLADAEVISIPMADGGEGTLKTLIGATGGRTITATVTGPLGDQVEAVFGILGDGITGVIEMASASGLQLVPLDKRDPKITTTFGTGELIQKAISGGCTTIIIGIGGSATNDGGAGMAQASGYRFLDGNGRDLAFGGMALKELHHIETVGRDPRLEHISFVVACDVSNPLVGPKGASLIYGPQKGATPDDVVALDQALTNYAEVVRKDLGIDITDLPGSGAAGGLGGGLVAFLNAKLQNGFEIVSEAVRLKEQLQGADLVITGEGRIDSQTVNGKTPIGVARVAKSLGLPVLAVAGGLGKGAERVYEHGIDGLMAAVNHPMLLSEAMDNTENLVVSATERILRIYLAGKNRSFGFTE